jgi:hypothetical protein
MSGLYLALAVGVLIGLTDPPEDSGSYLYESSFSLDKDLRGVPQPYYLQPGDICFAINKHYLSRVGHRLSGAGRPNHSMIAFAHPNGQIWIMEAGPHSRLSLEANEAYSHLRQYITEGGRVWVRRRRTPLTAEQSEALTAFCLAQNGKIFPVVRLVGQLTPLRSRGWIRTAWMGKPDLDQRTYFCSELVLNALVAAGVLDPDPLRPSATYPRDLFFSASRNPHVHRGVALLDRDWEPPARWVFSIQHP